MNQSDKNNFWSKVKTSTKTITTSIGGLSLRSEHDGDSPESTLIHKALVRHYTEEGRGYPEWLGHVEVKQARQEVQQQPSYEAQSVPSRYQPQQQYRPDLNKYRRATSFKEENTQASQSQPLSPSKNRMKDRLKRHNYRNDFTVEW